MGGIVGGVWECEGKLCLWPQFDDSFLNDHHVTEKAPQYGETLH